MTTALHMDTVKIINLKWGRQRERDLRIASRSLFSSSVCLRQCPLFLLLDYVFKANWVSSFQTICLHLLGVLGLQVSATISTFFIDSGSSNSVYQACLVSDLPVPHIINFK